MEIDHTLIGSEQSRRDQLPLQDELSEQNPFFRETRVRNIRDMEELQKSHLLKIEELSRRKLSEDQNTIMEVRVRIQKLQNEVNCMNDSTVFEDAESVRSGPSHVQSQPALLPPHRDPGGLLSRNNQPPDIWNSQIYRKRFCKSTSVFFVTLPQEDSILGFLTLRKTQLYSQVRGDPLRVVNVRFQTQS